MLFKKKDEPYNSGYIAPKGWIPPNADEDYIITMIDIELIDELGDEYFPKVAAACAAESSTGTWTTLDNKKGVVCNGMDMANKLRATAFDLDPQTKTFKIAYKIELFETGNLSGLLAGVAGNIGGMKMLKAFVMLHLLSWSKNWIMSSPLVAMLDWQRKTMILTLANALAALKPNLKAS